MIEFSVIIPTCHRPKFLRRALISLLNQTIHQSRFEVIVVDNGPSDETAQVVNSFFGKLTNLRFLQEPWPGLHSARHRGMREAKSDFLVYCDDDIEALPTWLEGIASGFETHNAVLVGGKNLPKWEVAPPRWLKQLWDCSASGDRSLGYLSILDFGDEVRDVDPSFVWGCNFSIRKSVLMEAGGFHPDSMPNNLLHLRGDGESYVASFVGSRGYKSVYVPSASIYHFVPKERMTVDYFRKRAFNQGVSDSFTQLRTNESLKSSAVSVHPLQKLVSNQISRKIFRYLLPPGIFLRANINDSYLSALRWHRNLFANDQTVHDWVLKETYMDNQ